MNEDEKRLFDALESQRKAHYESFDQRRSYEWKLSFGLWTAMAAFIAALVTKPVEPGRPLPVSGCRADWMTGIVAVSIVAVHAMFLIGMRRSNNADRRMSWHFERHMREELLKLPFDEALRRELELLRERMARVTNWSDASQLLITLLLAAAGFLAVQART